MSCCGTSASMDAVSYAKVPGTRSGTIPPWTSAPLSHAIPKLKTSSLLKSART